MKICWKNLGWEKSRTSKDLLICKRNSTSSNKWRQNKINSLKRKSKSYRSKSKNFKTNELTEKSKHKKRRKTFRKRCLRKTYCYKTKSQVCNTKKPWLGNWRIRFLIWSNSFRLPKSRQLITKRFKSFKRGPSLSSQKSKCSKKWSDLARPR